VEPHAGGGTRGSEAKKLLEWGTTSGGRSGGGKGGRAVAGEEAGGMAHSQSVHVWAVWPPRKLYKMARDFFFLNEGQIFAPSIN
jgi:hypothetical protein